MALTLEANGYLLVIPDARERDPNKSVWNGFEQRRYGAGPKGATMDGLRNLGKTSAKRRKQSGLR